MMVIGAVLLRWKQKLIRRISIIFHRLKTFSPDIKNNNSSSSNQKQKEKLSRWSKFKRKMEEKKIAKKL